MVFKERIKNIIRFIYYKNSRKKFFRELKIKKEQEILFKSYNPNNIEKLIVFLVKGAEWDTGVDSISGGILSIASIFKETLELRGEHGAEVIMATSYDSHLLLRHTQFPNDIVVYNFTQLKQFVSLRYILVHVPEFMFSEQIVKNIKNQFNYLENKNIHFNILNQRLDLMPSPNLFAKLKNKGYTLSQTTAHDSYSNLENREKYGIPLHKLSVYATPSRYNFVPFEKKQDIILISPDEAPPKESILLQLSESFPTFKIEIINDLTYSEYLAKVEKAKYMITFGEGLDFYFIETIFSGGIGMAVYNETFFTPIFKQVEGVFDSYDQMKDKIDDFIDNSSNPTNFAHINENQFNAVSSIYNDKFYRKNLKSFYNKEYLFP